MEIDRALDHIAEIRHHLARTQTYRGIRSATLVVSGLIALVAALLQPVVIGPSIVFRQYILYWMGVAVLSLLLGGGTVAWNYLYRSSESERRITRQIVGQFVPAIGAGMILTVALGASPSLFAPILPGLWAMFYGLSVFAARPLLPRAIGWVALYYILAGGLLLQGSFQGWSLSPWGMGITFALGQFAAAAVLFWNLERGNHG